MDKVTRKTSFGQSFSPINLQLFEESVKTMKLDYYTKINDGIFPKVTTFRAATRN